VSTDNKDRSRQDGRLHQPLSFQSITWVDFNEEQAQQQTHSVDSNSKFTYTETTSCATQLIADRENKLCSLIWDVADILHTVYGLQMH